MTKTYQGKVYLSPVFEDDLKAQPKLQILVDNFKSYWQTGHHRNFGKDVPLHRPPKIGLSAVRHIHLRVGNDTRWSKPFENMPHYRRPSSEKWYGVKV